MHSRCHCGKLYIAVFDISHLGHVLEQLLFVYEEVNVA